MKSILMRYVFDYWYFNYSTTLAKLQDASEISKKIYLLI